MSLLPGSGELASDLHPNQHLPKSPGVSISSRVNPSACGPGFWSLCGAEGDNSNPGTGQAGFCSASLPLTWPSCGSPGALSLQSSACVCMCVCCPPHHQSVKSTPSPPSQASPSGLLSCYRVLDPTSLQRLSNYLWPSFCFCLACVEEWLGTPAWPPFVLFLPLPPPPTPLLLLLSLSSSSSCSSLCT